MEDTVTEEIVTLKERVLAAKLPAKLQEKALALIARLSKLSQMGANYLYEYESATRYLDWIINLPWENRSIDTLDINKARAVLDKNHYGLQEAKNRILEYLSVIKLNPEHRAPVIALIGLVGTGKTTLAYSLAESLGRKFVRIPFGGLGDLAYLRGQSRSFADAEPGAIIKALRQAGTKNPVILLDEIDRVDEKARAGIMGVLVELLDPGQNHTFLDHYLDFPFDLSNVFFVVTANNSTNISTAVLDRLEIITMPSYSDEEKITIGRDFILPKALANAGLSPETLTIKPELWPKIVRPLGFDGGIRSLERTINTLVRKTALQIVTNQATKITITEDNLQQYLA